MTQKHVAKSGASAGQWVTCNAQQSCRNGGQHISSEALKEISDKTYTPAKDLTEADVNAYYEQNPPLGVEKGSLLHKLLTLQPQSTSTVQESKEPSEPEHRVNDEYLTNDDSLSLEEKRRILDKQLNQADKQFGAGRYEIRRIPETQQLLCQIRSSTYVSQRVFTPNPEDNTKFSSVSVARTYTQGAETSYERSSYNEDGALHNTDGEPAYLYQNDDTKETEYCKNGLKHRDDDKPAVVTYLSRGQKIEKYYKEGKPHRDNNKPAVTIKNTNTGRTAHSYYTEGKLVKNTVINEITGKTQDLGA